MKVEVSIIVPIYNVENYLDTCIKSILKQTYREFELLLINDGTKDNSLEICRKYKNDRRVRIISQPNRGAGSARNTGIRLARGKFLAFIDADDYIDSEYIEILHDFIIKQEADIVQCGFIWIMENGKKRSERYKGCISQRVLYGDEWFDLYERNTLLFTVVWNKLYRKELFDQIKFPEGKMVEDEYVVFPIFSKSKKTILLNKSSYYYIQRNDGRNQTTLLEKKIESYFEYSKIRLGILWNSNKEMFGRYLNSFFKDLMYYSYLVENSNLNYELISIMKKKSRRLLVYFFLFTDISVREKIKIFKWNMSTQKKKKIDIIRK